MACKTNTARKSWFGVTALGDYGETMSGGVNAGPITRVFSQISNGLVWTPTYSQDEGTNGTPFYDVDGVAVDSETGSGSVVLEPRIDDWPLILPLLLGDTLSPSVDGYCDFFRADRGLGITTQQFGNCKTSQWTMSSSKSQSKLRLDWGIEACLQETGGDGSLPSGLSFSTEPPLRHVSMTMTIDGRTLPVDDISITGTNNLTTDQFYNNVFRQDLPANRQVYSFTCTTPFDNAQDVAMMALRAESIEAEFVYAADADRSMTITFPNLIATVSTPQTPSGDAPIRHEGVQYTAYSGGSGDSLVKPITFAFSS